MLIGALKVSCTKLELQSRGQVHITNGLLRLRRIDYERGLTFRYILILSIAPEQIARDLDLIAFPVHAGPVQREDFASPQARQEAQQDDDSQRGIALLQELLCLR